MPKNYSRTSRVGDLMHRIIARLIVEELKDPRVGMVTLSEVSVSPDLRHAKVFITILPDSKIQETLKVLNEASGFFRSHLAKLLTMRIVPRLHFIYDESEVRGRRMANILDAIGK